MMRPQERMFKYGIENLSIPELIALILRTGNKGQSALQIASQIAGLLERSTEDLARSFQNINGMGESKTSTLLAALELGKRIYAGKKTRLIISPREVWKLMKHMSVEQKEYLVVLYLNTRNQLIEREIISVGNLDSNIAHPREVFEPAVRVHAAQVIICHNHPSGEVTPSPTDIETTQRLVRAGEILGIEVTDHVIITSQDFLSMKAGGYF